MNETLLQRVLSCSKLPTLPAIALRVIEMTGDENVTMRELAHVIENDQGLAARILKTVNSAFYGLPKQCSTLTHAQSLLGLRAVKTLALGFTLVSSLKDGAGDELDYDAHWQRAIYSAIGAKAIASMVRTGDVEEAFLGGLLQDVGVVALARTLGQEYGAIMRMCGDDHHALVKHELAHLELQHPDVGAMLAERWRLPGSLVMPIKYHERPTSAPLYARNVVRAVALGNLVADILIREDRAHAVSQYYQRAGEWFSLTPTQADEVIEVVTVNAREVARMFEITVTATPDLEDIRDIACERLAMIALEEGKHAAETAAENEEFRRALDTDSLTGLGTRARFVREAAERFDDCRGGEEPLSVVFFDVDNFRQINDEFGEDVGDIILAQLGQRLATEIAPTGAEMHRYGGEEFGAVLPRTDRPTATQIADGVRRSITERPLDLSKAVPGEVGEIRLTLSVGVATVDRETIAALTRAERLIHAADKAVHAAKEAGGDCVRAFTPARRRAA